MTTAATTRRAPAKRAAARPRAASSKRVTAMDDALSARFQQVDLDAEPDVPDDDAPLFTLDGVEYRVPLHPSAVVALEYIEMVGQRGISAANVWALQQLLGDEAWEALKSAKARRKLTGKNLTRIIDIAVGLVVGALEDDASGPLGRG